MRITTLLLLVVIGGVLGALNPFEQAYLPLPNRNNTREFLFNYTSAPHLAGMLSTKKIKQ